MPNKTLAQEIQDELAKYHKVNPAVTNHYINLMHRPPEEVEFAKRTGYIPDLDRFTNAPNALVLSGHGGEYSEGMYPDDAVKPLSEILSPSRGIRMSDIAAKLGPATNDIEHILNGLCYAGNLDFKECKKYLPKLKDMTATSSTNEVAKGKIQILDPAFAVEYPELARKILNKTNSNFNAGDMYKITSTSTNPAVTFP